MSEENQDLLSAEQLLSEYTAKLAKTIGELENFQSASASLQEANEQNAKITRAILEASKALKTGAEVLEQEGVVKFADHLQVGLQKIRTTNIVLISALIFLVGVVGVQLYLGWSPAA